MGSGFTLAQQTGVTYGGGTVDVLKLTGYSTSNNSPLVFNNQMTTGAMVSESNFESTNKATDSGTAGLVDNAASASVQNGVSTNMGCVSKYLNQAYISAGAVTSCLSQQGTSTTAWLYGTTSYPGTSAGYFSGMVAPQLYSYTGGYTATQYVNPISGAGHLYLGYIFTTTSGAQANIYYNWGRARVFPPNGAMPAITLGSLSTGTGSPTSVSDTLGSAFTIGVSQSATSGSTTYESAIWYATAASSGSNTITATFTASVSGSVSIYEISGYSTSGVLSSSGQLYGRLDVGQRGLFHAELQFLRGGER